LRGFYAATKRKANAGEGYEPTLVASTRSLWNRVDIRVRDNGIGIPPEVQEKIFNPFFTTKTGWRRHRPLACPSAMMSS
jgi:signal transduction histidine kinase